jgi:hypothetical protein
MAHGTESVEIDRDPATVFAAIVDVTRIGEWSPECIGARWIEGATGPAVGAKFAGDNKLELAGITVMKWSTTSEVTEYVADRVFAFSAEGYTTWRYELEPTATGTRVTESYDYTAQPGAQTFVYETLLRRPAAMNKGMRRTLDRIKASVEAK